MRYDDDVAERLEAIYRGHDVEAQRAHTLALLGLEPGERVLDIGSGPGFLCQEMAAIVGPSGRVRGIDLSPDFVRRAAARNACAWLDYAEGDATDLPEPDAGYDAIVSTQVAEYVPDVAGFCSEAFRVLRPGGRGVLLATDWDALAFHSDDPDRMRRVLDAFKPHCADSVLPRTLAPRLRAAGFEVTRVSCFPIVNTDWAEGCYSRGMAGFVAAYARRTGALPEAEIAAWEAELPALAAEGRYFFLTSRILFEVRRNP
jgi:ubiquinone/menaquinone biosynthesis C-methylase UbiE